MDGRDVLPATARQKLLITRLSSSLGDKVQVEYQPMSVGEAGRMISILKREVRARKRGRKIR